MLQIRNETPFPIAIVPTLDREGREQATVVIKGTFLLGQGRRELSVSEEQAPILFAPEYTGKPGESSLRYETDAHPAKPGTDVVMVGCARATRPTRSLDVSLRAGLLQKTVRVIGDRQWVRRGGMWWATRAEPFQEMPLVYERAFGGWDRKRANAKRHGWEPRNPVGTGFHVSTRKSHLTGTALPNLEDPKRPIRSRRTRPAPAGFGFIAPHWQPRVAYAGTFDAAWERARSPLLPLDFDERFFHAAHPDLISRRHFEGGEPVSATGVGPEGRVDFRVPARRFDVIAQVRSRPLEARPVLDTVVIEPDEQRVVLTWRATFPCPGSVIYIDRVRVREK